MSYCKKCGVLLKDNQKFCGKCGTPVGFGAQMEYPIQTVAYGQADRRKGSRLLLGMFSVVVLIAVIIIFTLNQVYSKNYAIKNFERALKSKDAAQIAGFLTSDDSKLKLNEDTVKPVIDYMDKNPKWVTSVVNNLEQGGDFTLVNTGKKLLIFNEYKFMVKPYYIELNMKFKDSKVTIGDDNTVTADKDDFVKREGPFVPGLFTIKTAYSGKYINFQNEKQLELLGLKNSKDGQQLGYAEMSLNFEGIKNIEIKAAYQDARIYVNGSDTGVLVKDAKNFGPVGNSTKIYAVKNVNGKENKSKEIEVGENQALTLDFPEVIEYSPLVPQQVEAEAPIFNKITASSVLKEANYNYEPMLVNDMDKTTAWVEGKADDGIGEWITLGNTLPQKVSGIRIINGYAKNNEVFYKNNRVSKITLEFSDGSRVDYDLADNNLDYQTINFNKNITTQYIKVIIQGVYKGSTYRDTCISEISAF